MNITNIDRVNPLPGEMPVALGAPLACEAEEGGNSVGEG